jgi:hypothetical protein
VRGAKSYDSEKTWSSINHSMLSVSKGHVSLYETPSPTNGIWTCLSPQSVLFFVTGGENNLWERDTDDFALGSCTFILYFIQTCSRPDAGHDLQQD